MNISEIIRERRAELGLTLEDVGQAVGVGKSTVRKWEQGMIKNMRRDNLSRLAGALRLDPMTLLHADDPIPDYPNILPLRTKRVPLIGTIAAGEPIYADHDYESFVTCDGAIKCDFALQAQGDSMIGARILDGDIVFIRAQPDVEDGEIAAIIIDDDATLKRVYHDRRGVTLVSENPKCPPMHFTQKNSDTVRILGKAVAFQSAVV